MSEGRVGVVEDNKDSEGGKEIAKAAELSISP